MRRGRRCHLARTKVSFWYAILDALICTLHMSVAATESDVTRAVFLSPLKKSRVSALHSIPDFYE